MKVSLLDIERPGVFARYLPDPLPPAGAGVRQALALHEGDTAWGAALVEVGGRTVDILSLRYVEGTPLGTCERALTQTLAQNARGSAIQELVYIYQGDSAALEAMDDRMLLAGYCPRAGSAQPMEAALGDLLQNPAAKRLMQRPHPGVVPIEEGVLLRFYNHTHPATAISPDALDPLTSRCYVADRAIKAVLHTWRQGEDLCLEWLSNSTAKKEVVGWLLGAALTAAAEHYPPETRILLGVLPGPSAQIAERLSFTPVPGSVSTRIYTYYL